MKSRVLRPFYILTLVLFALAMAGAAIGWRSPAVLAGVAAGYLAGILPVLTWHWVMTFTDCFRRHQPFGILVVLLKLGLIGFGLYVLVTRDLLNVFALIAGMSVVTAALMLMSVGAGFQTNQTESTT